MESPGFIKKIHNRVEDEHHWLTRRKLLVFGATLIIAGLLIGLFESSDSTPVETKSEVIDLPIPEKKPGGTPPTATRTPPSWSPPRRSSPAGSVTTA